MKKDLKRLKLAELTESEETKVLDLVASLYNVSCCLKESEFKEEYIKNIDGINKHVKVFLLDKIYNSNFEASLCTFEFFIKENIYSSNLFLRRVIKTIIEDESDNKNAYKAIVIKCIKNNKNKFELYESIRKRYNMKYFFNKVKKIEFKDRIRNF